MRIKEKIMKKIILALLISMAIICLFTMGISAAEVITETEVTLNDGTKIPLYDENGEGLIWFILSTDENGVNTYGSVAANDNTADNATNYVTYQINSTYGTNQMHDIYIKVWNAETSAYDSIAETQIVAVNFRTFQKEYWSFGAIFNSNIQYVYHSATVRNAGGYTGNTNLKIVDASLATNYSDFAQQAFKGCTNLHTVRIGDSQDGYKLDGPQYGCLFQNCNNLSVFEIADTSDVTDIGGNAFENCYALTGTYTFNNVKIIGDGAFKYAGKNEGTNLILNFPSVEKIGTGTSNTYVFAYSGITELTFGDDVSHMSFNTFTGATRLWRIEFDGVAEGFNFPSYTFEDCSALKAFSIPEGITTLPSRMFKSCSSLTAVYLPSTLTTINSGSQDHATFANCTNLYFVSSAFKYDSLDDIPSKPDVYYFPSKLASIANGEVFKKCESLNKTLVFPAGVNSVPNGWTLCAGTNSVTLENVVFLGDMDNINTSDWNLTGKIYFANANDKSSSDITTYSNSKSTVFCHAEGNTIHLLEKEVTTGATYIDNAKSEKLCFCGHSIETVEQENTALFNVKGYSKNGDSLVYVVVVNATAIANYNEAKGVNIKYGIVASQIYNDGDLISTDGTVKDNTVLGADFTGTDYSILQIKVTGAASYADTALHCCAYVTDGAEVAYLYESEGKATKGNKANQIKYSDIVDN